MPVAAKSIQTILVVFMYQTIFFYKSIIEVQLLISN